MSTVALPTVANANPNVDVKIDSVQIGEGSGEGGQLILGDQVTISGTWDASGADPQAGETFYIGLPPELGFLSNVSINFMGETPDGERVAWATCLTDADSDIVTCTLTDYVTQFPEEVHGTFEFEVRVELTTTEEQLVFDLNGTDGLVELPGEGGIGDGIEISEEWTKTGRMNENNWSMTWRIEVPGSRLVEQDAVTIKDTLSDTHILCEPAGLQIHKVRGDNYDNVTSIGSIDKTDDEQVFNIVLEPGEEGFSADHTYRIEYQTCTPDGRIDAVETEYHNTAYIEIFGRDGERGVGINPMIWHGPINKSGSVLGGGDRNGKIAWTVTVPGNNLVGKDGFNLTETLGDGHVVGADTISGITIVEQYGPSNQRRVNITDQLDANVVSQDSKSFEIDYSIKSSSDFEFKESDYRYQISYYTYVDQTELPNGGTKYSNTVNVDGAVKTGSSTVPGRSEGKNGRLNGHTVVLDGVDHYPQTTMTWQVRIPGEKIEDAEGSMVLTDTLTDGHEVCLAGDPSGGLNDRLGLSFLAEDQISGGGLDTVNLSDSVTTTETEDGLKFSIPYPTLVQPDGTEAEGFSREYQYVLTYTTCTTSGGMDAPGTTYGNSIKGESISYSREITQSNRGSGTGSGVARGSFEISKLINESAPGAEYVADGQNFTVHVQEIDPAGNLAIEYDLQVPLNGDPVAGLNARGTGWTAVLTEPTFPKVNGVVFGDPVFSESEGVAVSEDGKTATVSLAPRSNVSVELTNNTQLGSISLEKAVDAQDDSIILPVRTYRVTAHVDTSALGHQVGEFKDVTVELTPGEPVVIDNLPIGATVTFSESGLEDDDHITWGTPTFSPSSLVVSADTVSTPAQINVLNTVTRTVGTFQIVKTVDGAQADNPAVPQTITFNAEWDEEGTPGSAVLEVPTDGTPVALGHDLLIGTRVKLTEDIPADGSAITWGTPTWTASGVTVDATNMTVSIVRGDDVTVAIENHANTSIASLELIKEVTGEAAGEVSAATEFPVTASWTDANGEEQSVDLMINGERPTPLGVDLPAGTVVTLTEGDSPEFTTVDWGAVTIAGDRVTDNEDGSAEVVISDRQGDVSLVTVTNETNWAASTFTIAKDLADTPGAQFVPDGTVFTVHVQEFDADGVAADEYDLEVPVNGDPVEFSNFFGPGWTAVLTEPTFPEVDGVVFGTPVFTGGEGVTLTDDGASAIVAYSPGVNATVGLTNEAQLGSISIVKNVEGGAAEQLLAEEDARTYQVTASINTDALGDNVPAQEDRVIELTAGEPVVIDNLPIGAVATFSEAELVDDDLYTWGEPTFSRESVTVEAGHVDEPATVTLTNTVERTVGTFSISKRVTGEQADNPAVPETVTIEATWDEEGTPGSETLTVPTDGTAVPLGHDLLIGTEVTLTEVPLEDGSSIAWAQPAWTGDSVTIDGSSAVVQVTRNADAHVTVENHAATSVAGISLIKAVSGEAAGEVAPETEFPVTLTWTDVDGEEQVRELVINSVEPTELGEDLRAGTVVTVTEGERPGFATVIWDDIVIGGNGVTDLGDGSAEIVVSDQQGDVTLVTVTNEATWAPGTFSLAKNVEGVPLDNPEVPETVTVTASWIVAAEDDGEAGDEDAEPGLVTVTKDIEIPTDGTPVAFGEDLPHGTEVTLTEAPLADNAAFSWTTPTWAETDGLVVHEDGSATLTIAAAQNPTINLTNTAEAILGNLVIVKDVTGDGAGLVDGSTVYPVTATWTDLFGEEQVADIELVAGEPYVLENLPFGTEVTLVEGDFEVPGTVTWEEATWTAVSENVSVSADGREAIITVTDEAGANASLTLENEFHAVPEKPVAKPTDKGPDTNGKGGLPFTGASVGEFLLWATILVSAGALIVYLVRRRNALN
ncbi:DUF5979 domain-containing protein [Flaviflexus massiliensis]|uniref:DUF5979 domain-containing protein n=1 Tax=Flaviflexus massiliensis TaxID=1522309 RepID=UPI0006D54D9D|nr:DUF5979 domain-containing protein [Flaviflexus massiliensis]